MQKGIGELQDGLDQTALCLDAINANINSSVRQMSDQTERQLKQQVVEYRHLIEEKLTNDNEKKRENDHDRTEVKLQTEASTIP